MTSLCQQIWEIKEWPAQWTKSLIIHFPKKGDSRNFYLPRVYHASDYGMEISSEKSKTMVNSRDESVHANIRMNGEILEEVDQFKYLGVTITKYGTSEAEIRIKLPPLDRL